MKKRNIFQIIALASLSAACIAGALALTGCTPDEELIPDELKSDTGLTGGVAATVNGVEIEEDKITRAINNMRLNYGYSEEDKWIEYLEKQKKTVEATRYEVIGQFVNQELVKQCAKKLDVSTNDEEIKSYVDKMAEKYSSTEAWEKAVADSGFETLEKYQEALNFNILEKKLQDKFDEEVKAELADDAKMVAKVQENRATYADARKSARILLKKGDDDLATEIYQKIAAGELNFGDAVKEYSIDSDEIKNNGGDKGWDKIDSPTPEYQEALTKLEEGAYSEPVTDKYGINIIMCVQKWTAPETISSLDEVPSDIVEKIKTTAIETDGQTKYDDWLKAEHPENDIQVNPMPENVPYKVTLGGEFTEEEQKESTEKALNAVIKGVEETASETTTAEAEAGAVEGAEDAAAAAGADAAAAGAEATPETDPAAATSEPAADAEAAADAAKPAE